MQSKQGIQVPNDIVITEGTTTIVITEPTRKIRRFEDNVTVIRTYTPDPVREAAAIRYMLRWVAKEVQKEKDESNKMSSVQSEDSGV